MRRIVKFLNNQRGMTLLQTLVMSFIAALVALAIAQMLVNTKIQTRRIQLLNTLAEEKRKLEYMLRDQAAFDQTINGGLNTHALFVNLRARTPVTELNFTTGAIKLVVYDASGVPAYDMAGTTASMITANGFTEKGSPCDSFNPTVGSGNDGCPFSYRILIAADCPQGVTCLDPQLKIVGRLLFNPARTTSSGLYKFLNLVPQANSASDSIADTIVDGKYDAVVKRTASSIARGFQLSLNYGNTGGTGGGTCPTSNWAGHPAASATGWVEDYDPHDLVSPTGGGTTGMISYKETGYWNCSLFVSAYSVQGYSFQLMNMTTAASVGTGSSIAAVNAEGLGRLETSFNVLSVTDQYRVEVKCDGDGTPSIEDLGYHRTSSAGTPYVITTLACSKMDDAF